MALADARTPAGQGRDAGAEPPRPDRPAGAGSAPVNEGTATLARFSLSELVERSGVPASSIHHYRRAGMIPPPVREAANRFGYDQSHLDALLRIRAHADGGDCRAKVVAAAIEAFGTRSYGEVSVSEIAEAAGVAKGTVYRYFESKEELLTAAIETLLAETAARFEATVAELGGLAGLTDDPEKTAVVFGHLVARVLPILLELGARAAKGHEPSADLARKVLRTLAETGGRPLAGRDATADEAVRAGLSVLQTAFGVVLEWAVGPDWPPDDVADPSPPPAPRRS